jgi:regulator of protease activity HflC (stomatin/prohibitin superfamily)
MDFGNFTILVIVLGLAVVYAGAKTVPQGQEWTVERFGRYTRTLRPGLNLIIPFIDRVGVKLSMMETVLDIPTQEVITKDNAMVKADAVAFYQVVEAVKAAYEVRTLEIAITNLATTNLRTVIGSMELDEVLARRDEINARLLTVVDSATAAWGIKVQRIEIKDLQPPADITESMARQMKAEREKRAEILTAEGERQAAILRAEGAKQSAILEAEGKRQAAFLEAEARERAAQAEAKATQLVSDAIAAGNIQAINYFVAQRYVDAFAKLADAPNQRLVFMPMEASSIIGAIGGIAALTEQAGAARPSGAPAGRS